MTKATRKLPTVLAAVAIFNSLLITCVFAAANNVEDVREAVAAFNNLEPTRFGRFR